MAEGKIAISVILPVFDEKENLAPLMDELNGILANIGKGYEVIAVNDGSVDGSGEILDEMISLDGNLKVVHFRKNFGQTAAFDAGFRFARGDIVITMDADLQNDPHDIPAMISLLEEGYDLVVGWRKKRKDGFVFRGVPSKIANWMIRKVTRTKVHDLGCSLKIFRRGITEELRLYGEMHRFIAPLAEGIGAKVAEYTVNHRGRVAGNSKYGLGRTIKVILDLLTVWFMQRYHTKPIYIFGGAGLVSIVLGFGLGIFVLWQKYSLDVFVHRNPLFLIMILLFIMGVQFLAMGLIAELVIRTYFESQSKSAYSIAKLSGFDRVDIDELNSR